MNPPLTRSDKTVPSGHKEVTSRNLDTVFCECTFNQLTHDRGDPNIVSLTFKQLMKCVSADCKVLDIIMMIKLIMKHFIECVKIQKD